MKAKTPRVSREPSRIAVFSPAKKLVGVFNSMTAAAQLLNVSTSSIHFACKGETLACQGWYVRELVNVILEIPDDFGTLTLEDFDNLNGEKRITYPDRGMRKKRLQP